MVTVLGGGDLFKRPAEIRPEEGGCPGDARQVVVVNERDPARAQQLPKVEKINEYGIEPVVAVHDSQVEPAALAYQAGQRDLRFLGMSSTRPPTPALSGNCRPHPAKRVSW